MKDLAVTSVAYTLLVLALASGHVSGDPTAAPQTVAATAPAIPHLDPHVGYYQQHLINLGLAPANPPKR